MEKIYVDVNQTYRKNKKKLFSLNLKIYKNKKKSFEALLSEESFSELIMFSATSLLISGSPKLKKRLDYVNNDRYLKHYSDLKSDKEIKDFIKNWAIIIAYEIKFKGEFEHIYHAIVFATRRLNSKSNNYYNLTAEFISKAFKLEAELTQTQ